MNPLVSVIVPNYNHARFLRQRLDSIFGQTYLNIEVIILDDQSGDDSLQVIDEYREHPKIAEIIPGKINTGYSIQQWKKGFMVAKGEWIWIAESDDFASLNFLEEMLKATNANPDIDIAYCQTADVDVNGEVILNRIEYTSAFGPNIWKDRFLMHGEDFIKQYMKVKNVIPNASAVIFKRSLIDFSTDLNDHILYMRYTADWLFWIRLLQKTNIFFVPMTLNFFRDHSSTTRVHNHPTKIKGRAKEEVLIRQELYSKFPKVTQEEEWELIYVRWFSVHGFWSVLVPGFWAVRCYNHSLKQYLAKFLQFRRAKK